MTGILVHETMRLEPDQGEVVAKVAGTLKLRNFHKKLWPVVPAESGGDRPKRIISNVASGLNPPQLQ